jgi:hypothetical protein
MIAPAAGVLLVVLHGLADLVGALMDPSASYGQYGIMGVVAGRLISFYLLWLLVVEIPVVGRMVPWVVMDSDRPANVGARKALAVASAAIAVGLMTWIWTQAAGILLRPVFTWTGLSSATAHRQLQVSGWRSAGRRRRIALMSILRIQQASRCRRPRIHHFRTSMDDSRRAERDD